VSRAVLLIEDDPLFRTTLKLNFEGKPYEFFEAESPAEGIELLNANPELRVIVLDLHFGKENGTSVLDFVRAKSANYRVIVLTGHDELLLAETAERYQVFQYLPKAERSTGQSIRFVVDAAFKDLERTRREDEDALLKLLQKGESAEVEFKASLRWDTRQKRVNKELELVVVRTVAAFLNSETGGTLLIGVDDIGEVKGLQADFETINRANKDGFENLLVTLLIGAYGKEVSPLLRIDFPQVGGVEICRICAKPSYKPAYVPDGKGGQDLYIRSGNSTRKLNTEEAIEYSRVRWSW
jgi:ActR/RegA family two-component response regulator